MSLGAGMRTTLWKQVIGIVVGGLVMLPVQDASAQPSQHVDPDVARLAPPCEAGDRNACAKLADLAKTGSDSKVRAQAVGHLADQALLADIARHEKDWQIRHAAIVRLTDQGVLTEIATQAAINSDRMLAAEKLVDDSVLTNIIKTDDPIVRKAAAGRLGRTVDLRCGGAPTDQARVAESFKKMFVRTPYVVLEGVSDSGLKAQMSTALVEVARQILSPAGIAVATDGQVGSAAVLDLIAIGEAESAGYVASGVAPSGGWGGSTHYSGASWTLISTVKAGDQCIWGEAVLGRIGPPNVIGGGEYSRITDAPFRDTLVLTLSDALLKLLTEIRATKAIATLARTSKVWQVRTAAIENLREPDLTAAMAMTLRQVVKTSPQWQLRKAAVEKITDQKVIAAVALTDSRFEVRIAALKLLIDQAALSAIAMKPRENVTIRQVAVGRLTNEAMLADVARMADEWNVRSVAVDRLTDQAILAEIAKGDHDSSVQRAAIYRLTDPAVLAAIVAGADSNSAKDARKRLEILKLAESNQTALAATAKNESDYMASRSAVGALTDTTVFVDVARSRYDSSLSLVPALQKLSDETTLGDVARVAINPKVGLVAVERITEQRILADIAKASHASEVRRRAVEKLTDSFILSTIVTGDDDQVVRRAARKRLENLGK